jgi:hypothetical protein
MAADPIMTLEEYRARLEATKESSDGAAARPDTRPESLTLEEMLARFAHVAKGPIIVDTRNTHRRLRPGEFAAAYAHNKIVLEKKAIPTTVLWSQSEQRMSVDCLTFHPGEGQFYIERGLRHLNIWCPPTWPVVDTALAAPFLEHVEYLIPDKAQREDLLDWLAHAAQRPEMRPHFHFLLVAAQEGTGRSWLVEVLRRVWGERHAGETDLHRLLDDSFNSMLSGKILVAVHEVRAPADERYSHRDRLKGLLTDTILTVNEKHEPRWTERFCARFLMFTNRDDALPLAETDRRVYAVRCADEPRDAAYYTALYGRLADEQFLAAVWHLLKSRDLGKFNPGRRAPLNEMKAQMIAAGRSEEQQTAVEFARACPHDVIAATDLMHVLAPREEHETARDRKTRMAAIAAALKEIGAQTSAEKVWMVDTSTRVWFLRNPSVWTPMMQTTADKAGVIQEARRARDALVEAKWLAEVAIERWRNPQ